MKNGKYLIDWMDELDWCGIAPMGGYLPLSWVEIEAWSRVTSTELDSDDALLIRHLSKVYVNSLNRAKDPTTPAPYADTKAVKSSAIKDQLLAWANSFPENHFKR